MLIVCNGAFKSGSTWVEKVVRQLTHTSDFPKEFRDKNLNRCLDIKKMDEFLSLKLAGSYVTKSHVSDPRLIFTGQSAARCTKVIMISRDPRDVLVSYYFHFKNTSGVCLSLPVFYYFLGRFKLCEISRYNRRWRVFSESDVLWLDYESMKTGFNSQLNMIAEYLDVEITDSQRQKIVHATSLGELKNRSLNPKFYRKGEVGDWVNYINPKLTKKIMDEQNYIPLWVTAITLIIFNLRRKVFKSITFFRGV